MLIRTPVKGVSVIGRNTQGVRLITLESAEEKVVGITRIAEAGPEAEPGPDGAAEPPEAGPDAEPEPDPQPN